MLRFLASSDGFLVQLFANEYHLLQHESKPEKISRLQTRRESMLSVNLLLHLVSQLLFLVILELIEQYRNQEHLRIGNA